MSSILVDQDRCTRCGICSVVCPVGIVTTADSTTLPRISVTNEGMCIRCGHCEVSCPSHALMLDFEPDEMERIPEDAGIIDPENLGYYMKTRRSVRHFRKDPVPKETITRILDITRYAPSAGNGQPVRWIVVYDPARVQKIAGLTVEWMRTLLDSSHPLREYIPVLISAFEHGRDVICRGAPHLLVSHIPADNPVTTVDATIAMTYFDTAAPAFGVGTCWAGFVAMAASSYGPLIREIGIPDGRRCGYVMMFGHPQYKIHGIPRRNRVEAEWK